MNKTKIILIVLLVIAVILLGLFWYLSSIKQKEEVVIDYTPPIDTNQPLDNEEVEKEKEEPVLKIPQASEQEKLQAQLIKMSSAFVERYGSFSNQSDFENLEDLLQFMSKNLEFKTQRFINDKRFEGVDSNIYYGMTTKVLNNKSVDFSSGRSKAFFKFSTQRQEVVGSSINANVFYQDVEIELIKEAGVWKIDKINWL